ncbi:MAG: hypothetical protein ABIB47_01310 [Candidatus Woesearchaeota archaeon]
METTIQKILHQPSIKLNKTALGKYSWTITLDDDDISEVIRQVEDVNNKLLEKFPNQEKKKKRS